MSNKLPKFNNVSGLLYPESGNIVECISSLVSFGLCGYCSPLHAPDEEIKKPHYHVFITLGKTKGKTLPTWNDIFKSSGLANGWVEIINNPVGMANYLVHANNPEKEQFPNYIVQKYVQGVKPSKNVLLEFGDISCFKSYITCNEIDKQVKKQSLFTDIILWCSDNCCYSYSNLMLYAINYHPEWVDIIAKYHAPILAFQKSANYTDTLNANMSKRDKYTDKQESKVVSIFRGSDELLNSSDIECYKSLHNDGIL